jgi:Clostripain family
VTDVSAGPEPSKEWTFLLYVGAVNSLGYTPEKTLEWLAGADIPTQVAFVYEIGTAAVMERGRIYRDEDGALRREVLYLGPRIDTASERCITDFVNWGTGKFPSRYTALVLKDHGLGLDDPPGWAFMSPPEEGAKSVAAVMPVKPRAIMIDDVAQDVLSNPGLRAVVERSAIRKVDIYAFDACDMNLVEVLYEIRDVASYVVATPLLLNENPTVFPYKAAMNELARRADLGPREISRVLATSEAGDRLVATETAWLNTLAASIDGVARALSALLPAQHAEIDAARLRVTNEANTAVDLKLLLADLRSSFPGVVSLTQAAAQAEEDLEQACFAAGREGSYLGVTLSGTQIFFPSREATALWALYGSLEFARTNRWTTFLAQFCWPKTALY